MSAINNLWMISAVTLPSGQINQITDSSVDPKITEIFEGASGAVDAEYAAIMEESPMVSFTSSAVAQALGLVGLNGLAISSATDIYFQRIDQGGVRGGSSTAIKVTVSKGMVVPRSLTAKHKSTASISYDLHAISSDGTTAPLTITPNVTMPAINPVSQLFTVGPVTLNGSALPSVDSSSLEFGINETTLGADGNAYPTFTGIITRRPKFKVSGYDMPSLSTFGMNGLALTTWKLYLRKILQNGTRVPDGTSQHVLFSGTSGMFRPEMTRGSTSKEIIGDWCIHPTYDGTNPIIAISTGSAIT